MEATQQWTTLIVRPHRPWLLVGRLLVGRNTKEAMILLVGDRLVGPKGALLVDLRLVESSPPWYFALLVGTRLVDVPLRDTHGRAEGLLLEVTVSWYRCGSLDFPHSFTRLY
jgi:hypothetical protein